MRFFRSCIWKNRLAVLFVAGLCSLFFTAASAATHTDEHPTPRPSMKMDGDSKHQHHEPPAEIGLEPKIGATLPLETVLVDEAGKPVRLGDLVDRPTLILPIYYRCPNVCNFLQAGVAGVIKDLGRAPEQDFRILSISFNADEDAADARKARQTYSALAGHGFPQPAWRFLTGDEASTRALFAAAGYQYMRRGDDFLHPVVAFVISPDGRIVRYLHGTRPLAKDLTLALYEAETGKAGATIRKVVQFCFTYDAENKTYVLNLLRISATVILGCMGLFLAFLLLGGRKKKKDGDV